MQLTARQLNRATLARQGLLQREKLSVPDAVHRAVALQAQEAPSPYIALWNRVAAFDPEELDQGFADQTVVKAQLMRITLHAVAATDYHGAGRADVIIGALASDAIDLLTGPARGDIRACGAPGCVLMFLKDHPRREWCSNTCGNRARQARHYHRARRQSPA